MSNDAISGKLFSAAQLPHLVKNKQIARLLIVSQKRNRPKSIFPSPSNNTLASARIGTGRSRTKTSTPLLSINFCSALRSNSRTDRKAIDSPNHRVDAYPTQLPIVNPTDVTMVPAKTPSVCPACVITALEGIGNNKSTDKTVITTIE